MQREVVRTFSFSAPFSGKVRDVLRSRFSARFCSFLKKELGRVAVNGAPVTALQRVNAGDTLTVHFSEPKRDKLPPCTVPYAVRYEDEDVLVVEKGKGIPTVYGFGHENNNLLGALSADYENANCHIVTRLDKDTRGLVLVAKTGVMHSILQAEGVQRTYLALLTGKLTKPVRVDAPIARGADITRVPAYGGKPSVTEFFPEKAVGENTLCRVIPLTGRTHQIRVHAKLLSHPLVGDTLYGSGVGAYNGGQALICYELTFRHPVTGTRITVTAKNCDFLGGLK